MDAANKHNLALFNKFSFSWLTFSLSHALRLPAITFMLIGSIPNANLKEFNTEINTNACKCNEHNYYYTIAHGNGIFEEHSN